ncbi:MAG: glycosyltransferase family 39 protein [Parcubacteria group bacterium]|nr:glycosyltransferase family 39 protein [Parcubacteria group bacterium]
MRKTTLLILTFILAVSAFFRFYKIAESPPGLYPDEAANGVNALDVLAEKNWKVFYPENNGREGLFINLQSLSVKYFGVQTWSLRIVSGIFGTLTVLGLFFLIQLFWGNSMALLASYLMAVSFWPVNFSRIGFRAAMLPFILVWAFYFLWSGMINRSRLRIWLAGLIYGLGFHTYISWRVSPLLLILTFLILLIVRHPVLDKKLVLKSLVIFGIGAVITMTPLLAYYIQNPADFLGRAVQVSIFNSPAPGTALAESAIKTLGMFNFYGDGNWRHNLAGRPELFWPIGIGFLIGLFYTLRHIKSPSNFFLILWFLVMLLPNFLAPEGAPHALRALGAMPAVFILSAVGLSRFYNWLQNKLNRSAGDSNNKLLSGKVKRIKRELAIFSFLFLAWVGLWEYKTYFVVWSNKLEVVDNFDTRLTHIADYLNQLDSKTIKYVVVNESGSIIKDAPIQAQPIMFLSYNKPINYITPDKLNSLPADLKNAVIIPTKTEKNITNRIKQKYPQIREVNLITFRAFIIK